MEKKQKSVLLLEKAEKEKINLEKLLSEEQLQTEKVATFDSILSDIYHCLEAYKKIGDIKIFYKEFIKLYHVPVA